MDKKEAKRDVAMFVHNLKDLMNDPLDSPLATFDRDLQNFIYGRMAILYKHNADVQVPSLVDFSGAVGAAYGAVVIAFCENQISKEEFDNLNKSIREVIMNGYDYRINNHSPSSTSTESSESSEESVEPVVEPAAESNTVEETVV